MQIQINKKRIRNCYGSICFFSLCIFSHIFFYYSACWEPPSVTPVCPSIAMPLDFNIFEMLLQNRRLQLPFTCHILMPKIKATTTEHSLQTENAYPFLSKPTMPLLSCGTRTYPCNLINVLIECISLAFVARYSNPTQITTLIIQLIVRSCLYVIKPS